VLPAEQSTSRWAEKQSQQDKPVVGTHQSYQEIGLLASSSGTTSRHHPAQGARCGQQGGRWLDEGLPIPSKEKGCGEGKASRTKPTAAQLQLKRGKGGWRLASRDGRAKTGKQAAGGFGGGSGEGGDAAAGSRPNPPPHHYWSKDVGKQKEDRELEAAGLDGWRWREGQAKTKEMCRESKQRS